jgi:hypothetical protein
LKNSTSIVEVKSEVNKLAEVTAQKNDFHYICCVRPAKRIGGRGSNKLQRI